MKVTTLYGGLCPGWRSGSWDGGLGSGGYLSSGINLDPRWRSEYCLGHLGPSMVWAPDGDVGSGIEVWAPG